jgi:hypothetical protein
MTSTQPSKFLSDRELHDQVTEMHEISPLKNENVADQRYWALSDQKKHGKIGQRSSE